MFMADFKHKTVSMKRSNRALNESLLLSQYLSDVLAIYIYFGTTCATEGRVSILVYGRKYTKYSVNNGPKHDKNNIYRHYTNILLQAKDIK